MEAADVAAFMMADDEEEVAAPPGLSTSVHPNPHYNSNTSANVSSRPVPRPPAKKTPSARTAAPKPPGQGFTMRFEEQPVAIASDSRPEDIRNMLMEEETVLSAQPSRFEPLSSEIEVEAVRRATGRTDGARGGGFSSVVVVGTEERAETMEESARTFVAYRIGFSFFLFFWVVLKIVFWFQRRRRRRAVLSSSIADTSSSRLFTLGVVLTGCVLVLFLLVAPATGSVSKPWTRPWWRSACRCSRPGSR
jgi:hypothetical protein